jgi:hypothetical protein
MPIVAGLWSSLWVDFPNIFVRQLHCLPGLLIGEGEVRIRNAAYLATELASIVHFIAEGDSDGRVISASDDLRAAAQEVEEPGPSKPNVKQLSGVKHLSHTACGSAFFHPELKLSRPDQAENSECLDNRQYVLTRSVNAFSGRAPPSSHG